MLSVQKQLDSQRKRGHSKWMEGHWMAVKLPSRDIRAPVSLTVSSSALALHLMSHSWFHSHSSLISGLQFGRRFNYWCGLCRSAGIICELQSWEQTGATCHPVMCCSFASRLGNSNKICIAVVSNESFFCHWFLQSCLLIFIVKKLGKQMDGLNVASFL